VYNESLKVNFNIPTPPKVNGCNPPPGNLLGQPALNLSNDVKSIRLKLLKFACIPSPNADVPGMPVSCQLQFTCTNVNDRESKSYALSFDPTHLRNGVT
jgi:hypothetical protein